MAHLKYCFLSFLLSSSLLMICQQKLQIHLLTNLLVLWLTALLFLLFAIFSFLWSFLSKCRGQLLFENIFESFYLMHTLWWSPTERFRTDAINSELEFNTWSSVFPVCIFILVWNRFNWRKQQLANTLNDTWILL